MSRTARIAGVSLAGGILMATAIVIATRDAPPPRERASAVEDASAEPLRSELRRCRTITMPDSGCERAWEAQRNRFFGRGDREFSASHPDELIGKQTQPAEEGER